MRADEPWLLRFFDQVRFYPVDEAELTGCETTFAKAAPPSASKRRYSISRRPRLPRSGSRYIASFRARQQEAFVAEVARWQAESALSIEEEETEIIEDIDGHLITSHMHGSVWKVLVEEGQTWPPVRRS